MSLLNQLAPSALTRNDEEITEQEGELPSTFVPGQKSLFLSFAGVLANKSGQNISLLVFVKQISVVILIVVICSLNP